MRVTHRVKDSAGNDVGYIADERFYTNEYLIANVQYIDNLVLTENGLAVTGGELERGLIQYLSLRWGADFRICKSKNRGISIDKTKKVRII